MKKIFFLSGFLIIFTLILTGCGSGIIGDSSGYNFTIDSAITYIEDAGFKVTDRTTNLFEMINAEDGVNVNVGEDNIPVELYIDGGDIEKSHFENPPEESRAFNVSNLYVYIHSSDDEFYSNLKEVFTDQI
ncbi:MAG: hypothetical protein ACOCRO_11695 [Halanaerobiales bacterium]